MATTAMVITDTHIGLNFPDDRIEQALWNFIDIVEDAKPELLFHLGDVFNIKKPDGKRVEFATQWFSALAGFCGGIVVLAGGHDQDAHMDITAIDFLDDISPKIEVFNEMKIFDSMCLLPYTRRLTAEHQNAMREASVVLMHQGLVEAPLDHGKRLYGTMKDAVPSAWVEHTDLTICGHIHTPWQNERGNIVLLGSPYQTLYRHPMCDRYCGMWDMENPAEFTPLVLDNTFYLNRVTVEVKEKEDLEKALVSKLPPLAINTYYYVLVAIEGVHKPATIKKAKEIVKHVYGERLDEVQIAMVLPKNTRTTYEKLRVISNQAAHKDPVEMLELWVGMKGEAYFKAHPDLKDGMIKEFQDIRTAVDVKLNHSERCGKNG